MPAQHDRRNSWPEYEMLVLDKIEKNEQRILELEKRVINIRLWIAGATGIVLFIEFMLKMIK